MKPVNSARFSGFTEVTAVGITAASNDIEPAIAVVVAVLEISSPEAVAIVVGPLVDVPVRMCLI